MVSEGKVRKEQVKIIRVTVRRETTKTQEENNRNDKVD